MPELVTKTTGQMPTGACRITVEGGDVLLIVNGKLVGRMPPQAADAMAAGLKAKAREAEAFRQRDRLASEEAVCLRAGIPIHLTDDPKVAEEAWKRSQGDPKLRKYLPNAPGPDVKSPKQVHTPIVIQHPPR